ncbi:MAG: hypothetical protein ACXV7J_05060 [Methylomonas sp.]
MNIKPLAIIGFFTLVTAFPAHSATYSFNNLTSNGIASEISNPEAAIKMDVSSKDASHVSFTFTNNNPGPFGSTADTGSISDIYFSNNPAYFSLNPDLMTVSSSNGVSFDKSASPSSLPGSSNIWSWGVTSDSNSPTNQMGVDKIGEWLTITLKLINNYTFADVITGLNNGGTPGVGLTVGLHVTSIGEGSVSNSYLSIPNAGGDIPQGFNQNQVPEPNVITLLGLGLLTMLYMQRFKAQALNHSSQ